MKQVLRVQIASLLIWCSAVSAQPAFQQPVLGPTQVIAKAEAFLRERGVNLAESTLLSVSFDFLQGKWWLHYQGKKLDFGNHFTVDVTNQSEPVISIHGGI